MAASAQLARQWGILKCLSTQAEGISAAQLAKRFSVSKNTVVRDIESLIAAGFAVRLQQAQNRHIFKLAEGVRNLTELRPTPLELLALYAARTQLLPLAGTPMFGDLMSLAGKVQGMVQTQAKGVLDSLSSVFLEHPRGVNNYREHQEIIDTVVDAVLRRRVCLIDYKRVYARGHKTHEMRPLRMFFDHGGLYVIALLGKKKYVSTLALERIQRVELTRRAFKEPRGLDIEGRLRSWFGVMDEGEAQWVEVLFSADAAPFIRERVWHPDQQLEDLADGRLRWRARVQGKYEVLTWVLSRGPEAELVRPKAWRVELMGMVEDLWGVYFSELG